MAFPNKVAVFLLHLVQVMSHVSAAQSANLIFLCVHRENYDFLNALAPQLKGKVIGCTVKHLYDTKRLLKNLTFHPFCRIDRLEGAGGRQQQPQEEYVSRLQCRVPAAVRAIIQ